MGGEIIHPTLGTDTLRRKPMTGRHVSLIGTARRQTGQRGEDSTAMIIEQQHLEIATQTGPQGVLIIEKTEVADDTERLRKAHQRTARGRGERSLNAVDTPVAHDVARGKQSHEPHRHAVGGMDGVRSTGRKALKERLDGRKLRVTGHETAESLRRPTESRGPSADESRVNGHVATSLAPRQIGGYIFQHAATPTIDDALQIKESIVHLARSEERRV